MDYAYSELLRARRPDSIGSGRRPHKRRQARALLTLDQRSPEQLFGTENANAVSRPLIVAFSWAARCRKSVVEPLGGSAIAGRRRAANVAGSDALSSPIASHQQIAYRFAAEVSRSVSI